MDDGILLAHRPEDRGWAMLLHRRLAERFGAERVLVGPLDRAGGPGSTAAGSATTPRPAEHAAVQVLLVPEHWPAPRADGSTPLPDEDDQRDDPLAGALHRALDRELAVVAVALGAGSDERAASLAALADLPGVTLSPLSTPGADADLARLLVHVAAAFAAQGTEAGDGTPTPLAVGPSAPAHPTIAGALRAAAPGTTIRVQPGVYPEALFIAGEVEIVGEGRAGEVVVEAPGGVALRSTAARATVRGLTLRGAATGPSVSVTAGTLVLDGCDVAPLDGLVDGARHAIGVEVTGAASTLRLRASRVGRAHFGVAATSGSRAVVERSEVYDCRLSGITVEGGADASVADTSAHGHGESGVLLTTSARGRLHRLDAHDNERGVSVQAQATATVHHGRLGDNRSIGLACVGGTVRLEGVDLEANGKAALFAGTRGRVEAQGGRAHQGPANGVVLADEAELVLTDVEVCDNGGFAALAYDHATLRLERARVHDNHRGVVTTGRASLRADQSEVRDHPESGIAVLASSDATVRGCEVLHNGADGVEVHAGATLAVAGGRIAGNARAGLRVLGGGATLRGAALHDNEGGAVVVEDGGTVEAADVEVDGTHHETWTPTTTPAAPARTPDRFLITATSPPRTFRDGAFRREDGLRVHPGPGPGTVDLDTPRGAVWMSPTNQPDLRRPASHVFDHGLDRWLPLDADQHPDLADPLVGIDVRRPIGIGPDPGAEPAHGDRLDHRWDAELATDVGVAPDGTRYRFDLADEPVQVAWPVPHHHEAWEVAWSPDEQAWVSWHDDEQAWVRWHVRTGRWVPAEHELD